MKTSCYLKVSPDVSTSGLFYFKTNNMKNLAHLGAEYIDSLPVDTLSLHLQKKDMKNHWSNRSDTHKVNHVYPWKHAHRILEKYVGKPFDQAFTRYCQIVPKYQQKDFLDAVKQDKRFYRRYNDYFVDDQGLIQRTNPKNKYKGPYVFQSADYTFEMRHKITGAKKPEYMWIYRTVEHPFYTTTEKVYKIKGKYGTYTAIDKDFEPILLTGFQKSFGSKEDPRFKRLQAEKRKAIEKKDRIKRKIDLAKTYSYISKSELEEKKEKEINKYKILAHGFDLETSFRTEKQTNPDLIKEKQ